MQQSTSSNVRASRATPPATETHLHGWLLVAARALVFVALAVTTGLFVLALPGSVSRLATPCADPMDTCLIAPEQVAPLARLGITPTDVAVVGVVLSCLGVLLVDGVALVLLWRRSDDWMALLVALSLIFLPLGFTPVLHTFSAAPGVWQVSAALLSVVGSITLLFVGALFPSGRLVPRWLWIVMLAVVVFGSPLGDMIPIPGPEELGALLVLAPLLCLGGAQLYRYWRVSTPVQRQQTKWVVSGLILFIVVNQAFWQPYVFFSDLHRPDSLYLLLAYLDSFLLVCILVGSFSVAILRYRLWDIDAIINKTLVYGFLTGLLGAIYAGLILGLQGLAGAVSNQTTDEPIILVISTLVIAALFQPVRRRIQTIIDRRFYRRKYDAEKALATFSAALRNEVDLEHVQTQLLAVVQETMQPAHASLWLRPAQQRSTEPARHLESPETMPPKPGSV
ncbi:MAG TPA: hypothetical protein VH599_02775 [Ktedonobacterales bacterium]|jgi:hypothetical protein